MGKAKGKHRLDKYYHLAKEHGYRSRASWKLVQLNSKFQFLESARSVLDLCAAPGGWMQVAVQRVPVDHLVIGVDLAPIAPIRGAIAIQEDITKTECKSRIKKLMGQHGCRAFDVILHDGSPNIGGAWAQEAMSQNALVIDAVRLATQFLAPKGIFVTKIFRSQDYSSVVYCLKQLFEKVEVDKPAASRSESAEIYVLGLRYKAPAKIDPRLLDVKHLFQGSVEPQPKVVDVLRDTKQKRHRDGYEDGNTTLRKMSSASNFIWSDSPLEILGSVTSITFTDAADLPIKDHEQTTEEVKSLCDDLRVLGKQDFKHLLKWRIHIRKALSPTQKPDPTTKEQTKTEQKVDEEDILLNEMEELTNVMDRKKKHAKKLLAKRRAKDKARKATGMQMDAVEDGYVDQELFSLASIKGKKDLVAVDNTEYEGDEGEVEDSENEEIHEIPGRSSSDLEDSDEERKRYNEQMEDLLEKAYEKFVIRKEGSSKQRKRIKKSYDAEAELLEGGEDDIAQSMYDSEKLYRRTLLPQMARVAGIFLCLLILVMDVAAGILGFEAEIAQNKVKHLKVWIFECREPSHQAFMLGLVAAVLLGLAHAIANMLGGCNCICSQQEFEKASSNRQISTACLILTWVVLGIGLSMLVIGTMSNNRSDGSCGFSHHHFLSIGGICCFVHGMFCIAYYVSATASMD